MIPRDTSERLFVVTEEKIQAKSPGGGAELRRMFSMFDVEKKGHVIFDDLMSAAIRWNLMPAARVKKECFAQWSIPEDGRISFDDFVANVLPQDFKDVKSLQNVFWSRIAQDKNLREVFRRIDVDKSGTIDTDEIIGELRKMHINVSYDIVSKLVQTFDEVSPPRRSSPPQLIPTENASERPLVSVSRTATERSSTLSSAKRCGVWTLIRAKRRTKLLSACCKLTCASPRLSGDIEWQIACDCTAGRPTQRHSAASNSTVRSQTRRSAASWPTHG